YVGFAFAYGLSEDIPETNSNLLVWICAITSSSMRPEKLFTLFTDVNRLAGVGPAVKQALGRLLGKGENGRVYIRDLLFHLPISVVDRRNSPTLKTAKDGDIVTLAVTVESHSPPAVRGKKIPYKVICHTQDGYLTIIFFHGKADYIKSSLPVGSKRVISGKL